jgi:hypothetical protein
MTINDKWLMLEAKGKLIHSRFDFDAGIHFTLRELKKAAMKLNHWGPKSRRGITPLLDRGIMELVRKDFVDVAKKNIEREPVNAVFLLDGSISVPVARRINGACLLSATSLYYQDIRIELD